MVLVSPYKAKGANLLGEDYLFVLPQRKFRLFVLAAVKSVSRKCQILRLNHCKSKDPYTNLANFLNIVKLEKFRNQVGLYV